MVMYRRWEKRASEERTFANVDWVLRLNFTSGLEARYPINAHEATHVEQAMLSGIDKARFIIFESVGYRIAFNAALVFFVNFKRTKRADVAKVSGPVGDSVRVWSCGSPVPADLAMRRNTLNVAKARTVEIQARMVQHILCLREVAPMLDEETEEENVFQFAGPDGEVTFLRAESIAMMMAAIAVCDPKRSKAPRGRKAA